jgi:hypothetical protein
MSFNAWVIGWFGTCVFLITMLVSETLDLSGLEAAVSVMSVAVWSGTAILASYAAFPLEEK